MSVSQQAFVKRHAEEWSAFEGDLDALESQLLRDQGTDTGDFPARYRRVCQHLSLARQRRYGADLIERLNRLAQRGHNQLYRARTGHVRRLVQLFAAEFPRAVRREWRLVGLSHLLFYGVGLLVFVIIQRQPEFIYSVLDPFMVSNMEQMYDPANQDGLVRESDSDLLMFGYYIRNNVGIAFRTFAGGLLLGIGSLFFLIYNGLVIGGVFGHLFQIGSHVTLFPFVIGHGSFELTAICLSGAAGMRLGMAVVSPGGRSRGAAIAAAARRTLPILYGFAAMLFIAAFVEAFWSSKSELPDVIRYGVGALSWAFVGVWLLFGGRRAAE